ncbi:glycoside hydrolase family 76 protein [Xylaria bambusicola]|uniref:glycoside hydrolase family 76 protein n=1 Tax=Xylaria bambusicola TaxID=326684 RepID=UPI0020074685|nr:glycoside hydrolase family 76 protein [Xylaria bambusicola]KAI0521634.1 glycoside hydrolase family 76 protein [Xylaria bambusicola]
MSMYNGNQPGQIPGLLPQPYYWWEGGALMGALIDYWYYTGDTTYNDITQQGLLHQVGPYNDFMPPNQTLTEGNDDQGFWAMAAMSAAEYNFQNPEASQPQWLALAQAVFNTQAARWDTEHCNGGLRWQIFTWNNGFNYKNSISQACFFNLAARLALYTGNNTYAEWASKTWDWMVGVRFIDEDYRVYDGATVDHNCTDITPYEFSYNVGAFLLGAAAMVEYSNKANKTLDVDLWHERVDGLLNNTELIFFFGNDTDKVMIEVACESVNLCDVDQQSFKAYLSRWMAATTKWAPWTFDRIKKLLQNSARAAVKQCNGGPNGRMCGLKWANNSGMWDGTTGVGQQMAAMEVVLANMIEQAKAPVTDSTGGTSAGDPTAGGNDNGRVDPVKWHHGPIHAGDRAGAAFVTFVVLAALLAALVLMLADEMKTAGENWDKFRSTLSSSPFSSQQRGGGAGSTTVVAMPPPSGETPVTNRDKGKQVAAAVNDASSPEKTPTRAAVGHNRLPSKDIPKRKPVSMISVTSMASRNPASDDAPSEQGLCVQQSGRTNPQ